MLTARRCSNLVMFSAIPFLLLMLSQRTVVHTVVYLDGSVRREVVANFPEGSRRHVLQELQRTLPQADRQQEEEAAEGWQVQRSIILGRPKAPGDFSLQIKEIVQTPWSLFTQYTWNETLRIPSEPATKKKTDPSRVTFQYQITMPGLVQSALATPQRSASDAAGEAQSGAGIAALPLAGGTSSIATTASAVQPDEITGATAVWALSAEYEEYDLTVTSRRVRWGYLAVILYILAFIAYKIIGFLVQRARFRPRRI